MTRVRVWLARVRALVHARALDRDLQQEIDSHLDESIEEYTRQGLTRAAARTAALRDFGGVAQAHEAHREARTFAWIDDLQRDLQYATRGIGRRPGFFTIVVATLALGIGVNTALFSIVRQVLLKTLPVPNSQELVDVSCESSASCLHSYPAFRMLSEQHPGLRDVAAFAPVPNGLVASHDGRREVIMGQLASGNFFELLGLHAAAGRLFAPVDDRPDAEPVVVLSYGYWLRSFGAKPEAVGHVLTLNGRAVTVVGVLPVNYRGVTLGEPYDVVLPLRRADQFWGTTILTDAMRGWLTFIGRRNGDVTMDQLGKRLEPVFTATVDQAITPIPTAIRQRLHLSSAGVRVEVQSAAVGTTSSMRTSLEPTLRVLALVSTLILVIACVNIAGLFVADALGRQREFGVRFALGASRSRLVRQVVAESLVYAVVGGALGLLFGHWVAPIAFRLATDDTGLRAIDTTLDRWVIASGILLTAMTALVVGIVTVVRISRATPHQALRRVRIQGSSRAAHALLVSQIALTATLLGGATLLQQSLTNFRRIDVGVRPQTLTNITLDPGIGALDREHQAQFINRAVAALTALPDIGAVSYANRAPLTGVPSYLEIRVPGFAGAGRSSTASGLLYVGPAFVRTLGVKLLAGRDFENTDRSDTVRVAIVNASFARHFFGRDDVVGRAFTVDQPVTIVGVIGDVRDSGVKSPIDRMMYVPYAQGNNGRTLCLTVRAARDAKPIISAARQAIERIDRTIGIARIETVDAQVESSLGRERLLAVLGETFSGLALLLMAVGLFGLLNSMVTRRTIELGVRLALGATKSEVMWLIGRQMMVLVLAGVGLGAVGYVAAGRLIRAELFGVDVLDVGVVATTIAVLLVVAALAVYGPALRIMRLSPMEALRHDEP